MTKKQADEIGDLVIVVAMSLVAGWAASLSFPIWAFPCSLVGGYILILAWRGLTK